MKECDKKTWANIRRSRINQEVARPKIFQCAEFISLMVKQSDLVNRWIIDHKGQPIASFQPSNLEMGYRFPEAKRYMDEQWCQKTMKTNKLVLVKEWSNDCKRLRLSPTDVYKIERLWKPFQILMALLCRLYGLRDTIMFRQEWLPLVSYIVYKGTIFNWGIILSANFKSALATAKDEDSNIKANFYMSSYLMDACCAHNHFQKMKWTWSPREAPIHVYCNILWESKYNSNYERICNDFLLPLYYLLTNRQAFCMSESARLTLSEIVDWFVGEKFTYIKIYGATKAPHLLPRVVTYHIVLTEITESMRVLIRKKEHIWPDLPTTIGAYQVTTASEAEKCWTLETLKGEP